MDPTPPPSRVWETSSGPGAHRAVDGAQLRRARTLLARALRHAREAEGHGQHRAELRTIARALATFITARAPLPRRAPRRTSDLEDDADWPSLGGLA